ncbi:MAG: TIGR01777 family oxidoreductase [Candidatus Aminicenantes bacterium]|nr:TIGR01777 family oxidoreductase [Candidatus Aminicenantes bacterium]
MSESIGRIIVTGGTGFIGRALVRNLVEAGYDVVVLSRSTASGGRGRAVFLEWDGRTSAGWAETASGALGLINLAGENIAAGRWTKKRRNAILQSRIWAGEAMVEAVGRAAVKPQVLVQASAIGFYGPRREDRLDEWSKRGEGFLADVVDLWERSTRPVVDFGVRRVVIRSGIVLGPEGGAFPRLLLPFKLFAGGPLGKGGRRFSWIHLKDEVRAIRFLLDNRQAAGEFNLTAPGPVRQREFARLLGRAIGRPSWLPVPPIVLYAMFGTMAGQTLLADQAAFPTRLLEAGFRFDFPELEPALQDLTKGSGLEAGRTNR